MDTRTLIIIPRLGRPERVEPLLENIEAVTSQPYRVVLVYHDEEDITGRPEDMFCPKPGWAAKINWAYLQSNEPFMVAGADDLKFHEGWLEACLRDTYQGYGVVGTNDLGNPAVLKGVHSTHPFFARWYVDKYGTLDRKYQVMVEYPHERADQEFCLTARARNQYIHAFDAVLEHLHPFWGKGEWDRTYAIGNELHAASEIMWEKRKPFIRKRLLEEMEKYGIQDPPSPRPDEALA